MSDTTKLRKTIFMQCRRLGIDEDQRHEIQATVCGFESMKDATKSALIKMVEHLAERGAVPEKPKVKRAGSKRPVKNKPQRGVVRMITVAQRATIIHWARWKNLSPAYVRGISRRLFGRDEPQTTKQASALIAVLSSNRISPLPSPPPSGEGSEGRGRKEQSQ